MIPLLGEMSPKVTKGLPTGYGLPYEIKSIVLELTKYYGYCRNARFPVRGRAMLAPTSYNLFLKTYYFINAAKSGNTDSVRFKMPCI